MYINRLQNQQQILLDLSIKKKSLKIIDFEGFLRFM